MVRGRIIPTDCIPGFLTHDNNIKTEYKHTLRIHIQRFYLLIELLCMHRYHSKSQTLIFMTQSLLVRNRGY